MPEILYLETVDSTNSYLSQHFSKLPPVTAVYTQNQTLGKGRRGRTWLTTKGKGLAVSMVLPALDRVPERSLYPLIVGRVFLGFIHRLGLVDAEVKWPNDVLVSGKKLAGILCESLPDGSLVAGIGLNVTQSRLDLPVISATSLEIEGIRVKNIQAFTRAMVETFQTEWAFVADNLMNWSAFLSSSIGTIGHTVRVFESEGRSWVGFAEGIDGRGHLLVRGEEDEVLRTIIAEDVMHIR